MNPPYLRPLLSHLIAFTGSGSSLPAKIQTLRRSLSGSISFIFLFFSFAITNKSQPGSSSMIGLFQEHGPCRITNDSSTVFLNPMSWNNEVNLLYIDQPVGVGFSQGDLHVGTSEQAAADVWRFLQIFFSDSRFSRYQANPLAIWTES